MKISQKGIKWIAVGLAIVVAVLLGVKLWTSKKNALPKGIAEGNGRLESKLVDIAPKEPLRVKEILVKEGDLVRPGQVLVRMDTSTIDAEFLSATRAIAEAETRQAFTSASVARQRSLLALAETEVERSRRLVRDGAGSRRELDVREANLRTARAGLSEALTAVDASKKQVDVARANAAMVRTRIEDATLRSPVTGRVLYRLAEPGEVIPFGGKVLTLVNLEDIYMEIFLPAEQAASLPIGAEARMVLDVAPGGAIPSYVSFVSPEAQFTPKQVETRSERERLMFRVKIQLPKEMANKYVEYLKTGVRGVGYVKLEPSAVWPARLQRVLGPPPGRAPQ